MARGRRGTSRSHMAGIFTRSRSEIFVHRTRSGRGRPDPARRKGLRGLASIPPDTKLAGALTPDEALAGVPIHVSIKDLRARRVFSPASDPTECSPSKPDKIVPCDVVMDAVDPLLGSDVIGDKKTSDDLMDRGAEKVVEIVTGSEAQEAEEMVQTTPPDPDLLWKLDGGDGMVMPGSDAEVKEQVLTGSTPYAAHVVSRQPDPSSTNPSKTRLGSAPCLRSKLYQNPSSFAYRRLMPYLMDLEKDQSSFPVILPCHNVPVKSETSVDEKTLLLNADPPSKGKDHCFSLEDHPDAESKRNMDSAKNSVPEIPKSHSPKMPVDGTSVLELPVAGFNATIDSAESTVPEIAKSHSPKKPIYGTTVLELPVAGFNAIIDSAESTVPENSTLCPCVINDLSLTESPNLSTVGLLNDHMVTSDSLERYDDEFELLCKSSHCPPSNCRSLSVEELVGDAKALKYLPRKVEKGFRTLSSALEMDRKTPGSPQHGHFINKGNHVLAPKKGILKRHTRGCKGLCMCLDCASFRLHAERAYEFSRKQMLEADDVVLGLMKELTCLRNIIENSVEPADTAKSYKVDQVKGACQRALRVEEVTKSRLKEMFQELHTHCRVPGPRVTFVEESLFSSSMINSRFN